MSKSKPLPEAVPAEPFDERAMIEDLLARCRKAAETCFALNTRSYETQSVIQGFLVGSRLIKTALELADRLEGRDSAHSREFTHRIIVERPDLSTPAAALTAPPADGTTPPPCKNFKTISTVAGAREPQDGDKSA